MTHGLPLKMIDVALARTASGMLSSLSEIGKVMWSGGDAYTVCTHPVPGCHQAMSYGRELYLSPVERNTMPQRS